MSSSARFVYHRPRKKALTPQLDLCKLLAGAGDVGELLQTVSLYEAQISQNPELLWGVLWDFVLLVSSSCS